MVQNWNVWILLFLLAAGQGLFIGALLVAKGQQASAYLGSMVLVFSTMLIYYVGYWTGLQAELPRWTTFVYGFTLLLGPLLLGYFTIRNKASFTLGVHLIPFLVHTALVFVSTYYGWRNPYLYNGMAALQNLHLFTYAIFILGRFGHTSFWARTLSVAFLGYVLSFLSYYILLWTDIFKVEYDYYVSFFSCAFIYFIGYHGLALKRLLSGDHEKYGRSSLAPRVGKLILAEVKKGMEEEKWFLDGDLRLNQLATRTGQATNHISQAINDGTGKNFSDFVNEYRVKYALELMQDSERKLIEVAYASGFNNKASFINAFKKFTGQTPSAYQSSMEGVLKDTFDE